MPRYVIGIDSGSQSSKVTVFDEVGTVVSEGRVALRPTVSPTPGAVEHPGDDVWESIAAACRRAMAAFPHDPQAITGVGLCTIRFCRASLRADGTLAGPLLSWMDPRVGRPFEAESDDVARVTTSSGYMTHRLTGQFRDTAATYQGMWPIDHDAWAWSETDEAYSATGLRREQLSDLVLPGEILGEVTPEAAAATGLPVGLPVVATANDKAVEALGCGLTDPRSLLISLGTYIAAMSVGDRRASAPTSYWCNFASEPGVFLYESTGIRRGMWTISWFRDLLGDAAASAAAAEGTRLEEVLNREAEGVPAGSGGLLSILDWLAPTDSPHRRGTILGFDGRHGRAHVYRSLLEGIAFTMRRATQAMADEAGIEYDRLVVSGGGSSSDLMMQILADVFGLPTERVVGDSAAGRGAAICAAAATGVHASLGAAVEAMVHRRDRFEPDGRTAAVYAELGALHASVTAATDPLYERLSVLDRAGGAAS